MRDGTTVAPFVGLALLILPATAEAQYFGRNKVQYEHFDFKVLQTDHFDVYFYPNEREAADIASRMAERWYTRLSTVMRHQLRGRQPLILMPPRASSVRPTSSTTWAKAPGA